MEGLLCGGWKGGKQFLSCLLPPAAQVEAVLAVMWIVMDLASVILGPVESGT